MKRLVRLVLVLVVFCVSLPRLSAQVSVSETHVNNVCFAGVSGSIDVTVSGGTAPYTYLWNDGILTEDRTNIAAGSYNVTVTDFAGLTGSLSINITQGSAISVSNSITPVTCGGGNDGAIDLTVTGGAGSYTFLWADGASTEDRVNVTAANYYFTVTDASGCTKPDSANVTQPMGMVPTTVITDANCNASNGHIDLTVQYGYPPYTYLWNDGNTNQDRVSLTIGTYTVTVTDSINCSVSLSATVNQDNSTMSINHASTMPLCYGAANGSITITGVIGAGAGPFTYNWSNGSNSQINSGIAAGTYTVTVTNSNSCTATKTITLGQPSQLNTTLNVIPLTCFGSNNGAILNTPSGGTSPYTYLWNNGAFTQHRMGLAAGTYTVTVSDSRGCTVTASATVQQPLQLNLTATPNPLACIGGPTGSVTTSVTGGTIPYSYWWGAGITSANLVNVNAGTYSVTVTDANGCQVTGSATIPSYTPLASNTAQVTNVSCYAGNNGAVNITTLNGTGPYSYYWSSGQSTEDITNLTAGNYTVTITDNVGCTTTRSVTVGQPSFPVSLSSTITDANCFGSTDGSIQLTVLNGVAPYTFSWSDGASTQNRLNIAGGNYAVTLTDNTGCTATGTYTVAQPPQMVIYSEDTNVSCFGGNNGIAHPYITGGFAPYSYQWNVGGNTQVKTNLTAGTYTVTVTDTRGCSVSLTSVITEPAQVFVTATPAGATCNGLATGSINVAVSGAPAPLGFVWNDNVTTQNRNNLLAGMYTVSVTDSNGCINTASAMVSEPSVIQISETHINAGCNGAGTGSISLTVTGGTSPYNYNWNNGANTASISNLIAGSYSVTVTDANFCSASLSVNIGQVSAVAATATPTHVSCAGGANGTIAVSVSSGTAPFSFAWSDGSALQSRDSLSAGNYSVTVSDANNCSVVANTVVAEPSAITLNYTKQDATCYGAANGSIDLSVTGGTGAYSYNWSNSEQTQDVYSLTAANYTVTVTDANSCVVSAGINISEPAALTLSTISTPAVCYNTNTASVTATASGGSGTYQYIWSNGGNNATISNVAAGSYTVSVTDTNGCSAVASVSAGQSPAVVITETVTGVSCFGDNHGSISVTANGGGGSYTYLWNTGSNSSSIANLTAATYSVTVTDANGCSAAKNITLTQPAAIQLTTAVTNAGCNGTNTGAVDLTVSGGTGVYQYAWNTGSAQQDLSNIQAGIYDVLVTDNNSCAATVSVVVNQAPALQVALSVTDVACFGSASGAITTAVTGGVPMNGTTYNYQWSNNQFTPHLSGLLANTYTVTISDAANCSVSATATVQQPSAIQILETHSNVSCYGGNTGSINVTAAGGAGNYTYTWSNQATSQNIQNLLAGNYTVTVKDANNCSLLQTVTISQPDALVVSETHTNFACSTTQGSIQVTVNGGTAPYSYIWSDGSQSAARAQLVAGNYTVTAADANNCTTSITVAIAALPVLATSISKLDVACHAASTGTVDLTVSGGQNPYQYVWNTGAQTQDLQNIAAGTYDVLVTDANNCVAQQSVTVTQPASITINPAVNNVTCHGQLTGVVDLTVTGGVLPYNYSWSNSKTTEDVIGVPAGVYSVTVTDAANCQVTQAGIQVTQPQPLSTTATAVSESCHGGDGAIDLTVSGGNTPYSFVWNTGITGNALSGVSAGSYTVTVTDNKGCVTIGNYVVSADAPLSVLANVINASCPEVSNGAILLNVSGGSPAYTFNWSNGETTTSLQQAAQGMYAVTVTDAKGCSATQNFSLTYNYVLEVDAGEDKSIVEGQYMTLSATTNVNNGNNYNWSPAESLQCITCASTSAHPSSITQFVVEVTDENGCYASDSVLVEVKEVTQLYIPNAFTPNGDGNNDVFQAYGDAGSLKYFELQVFNRWGEKVFEATNLRDTWDATYRGEASPDGVYVYIAKAVYIDGVRNDYKGSVTIIR